MDQRRQQLQWLFLDPSVLLNENETHREARRLVAQALGRRGKPVTQDQVERAWMQAIAATRPVHPLLGAIGLLAPDQAVASAVLAEVQRESRSADMLHAGVQLTLNALQKRYKLGIIGPYRLAPTRRRLERFHLSFGVIALSDEQDLSHLIARDGKPDPGLFTWALRKAGVPAMHAAFATDRVDLGVAPANAAGLYSIWLRITNHKLRYPRSGAETPDLTMSSLMELTRL